MQRRQARAFSRQCFGALDPATLFLESSHSLKNVSSGYTSLSLWVRIWSFIKTSDKLVLAIELHDIFVGIRLDANFVGVQLSLLWLQQGLKWQHFFWLKGSKELSLKSVTFFNSSLWGSLTKIHQKVTGCKCCKTSKTPHTSRVFCNISISQNSANMIWLILNFHKSVPTY